MRTITQGTAGRTLRSRGAAARLIAAGAVVALALGACAKLNRVTPKADGIGHSTGANDLVLRISFDGGFVAPEALLTRIPSLSLYGDGSLITEGAQIEIYPGPALPNLQVTHLTEDGIQAILQAAKDAGLLGPDADYTTPLVADAATTVFTLTADGATHTISVYGMSEAGPTDPSMSEQERQARQALAAFQTKLGDLSSWLPAGSVGQDQPYSSDGIRVYVQPGAPANDQGLDESPIDWPLTTPLSQFGNSLGGPSAMTCGVVDGTDLSPFLPAAQQATTLSPWMSAGDAFTLSFRPLLPDESHACGSPDAV